MVKSFAMTAAEHRVALPEPSRRSMLCAATLLERNRARINLTRQMVCWVLSTIQHAIWHSRHLTGDSGSAGRSSVSTAAPAAPQEEGAQVEQVQQPGRAADGRSAPGGQVQQPPGRPGSL